MRLSVRRFLVGVFVSLAALSFYGAVKASSPDMPAKREWRSHENHSLPPADPGQALPPANHDVVVA